MRYSVWDYQKKQYDHYVAPGSLRDGVFAPHPNYGHSHRLGLSPDSAARRLPSGAKYIGSGPRAAGLIASRGGTALSGLGASIAGIPAPWLLVGAAAAYIYLRKKR